MCPPANESPIVQFVLHSYGDDRVIRFEQRAHVVWWSLWHIENRFVPFCSVFLKEMHKRLKCLQYKRTNVNSVGVVSLSRHIGVHPSGLIACHDKGDTRGETSVKSVRRLSALTNCNWSNRTRSACIRRRALSRPPMQVPSGQSDWRSHRGVRAHWREDVVDALKVVDVLRNAKLLFCCCADNNWER